MRTATWRSPASSRSCDQHSVIWAMPVAPMVEQSCTSASSVWGHDPEVGDAIWAGIEPLIPEPVDDHPLGCHRPRADNRDCFEVMLVRLVTGCSWEDAERLCGNKVSDTTVRERRD
ncbi:MAG: transposase [Acidimicrobiales bacterium]